MKIGDIVKFKTDDTNYIPNSYGKHTIPNALHGSIKLGIHYKINYAKIVNFIRRNAVVIEWKDINDKDMRLAFDKEDLLLVNQKINWKHILIK